MYNTQIIKKQPKVQRKNFREISSIKKWTKDGMPVIDNKLVQSDGTVLVPELIPDAADEGI